MNSIVYYLHCLIEQLTLWIKYIQGLYAGDSYEIRIAIDIIVGSVFAILLMLIIIGIRSLSKRKDGKVMTRLKEKYETLVNQLLDDDAEEFTFDEVKELFYNKVPKEERIKLLKKKRGKRMFCQMVYERVINDTGKLCSIGNLHHILNLFELHKFLENEVDRGNMKRKVRTMNMMNIFRIEINQWLTNTLLQSRNPQVRRQAMYASIMSGTESNMDYFESEFFDRNCCMEDEIELGYALQRYREGGTELPNLARLAMRHHNADTQCIFIRLMRRFEQKDSCRQLEGLFTESRSKKLTAEIARTWGMLEYLPGGPLIMEALPTQSDDTKVVLMEALARLQPDHAQNLFVDTFRNSGNAQLRLQALRCIRHIEGEEGAIFRELEASHSENDDVYFMYFKDDITKHFVPFEENPGYMETQTTVYHKPKKEIRFN